jgi:carnitine-CoA ligase
MIPWTLWELADQAAGRWPARTAWQFADGSRLTYADVRDQATRHAAALAGLGVGPGSKVAVIARPCQQYATCWLACARLGAVMIPLPADAGLAWRIRLARPDCVLAEAPYRRNAAAAAPGMAVHRLDFGVPSGRTPPAPPGPVEAVAAIFTAGSTGPPRLVLTDDEYWLHQAGALTGGFPRLGPADTLLTVLPMHHADPWCQLTAGLAAGARVVVADPPEPGAVPGLLRRHGCTVFSCIGALPSLLLRTRPGPGDQLPALRAVLCSGLPAGLRTRLKNRFGVPWYEGYGMAEAAAITRVGAGDDDWPAGSGSAGRPVEGRRVRVMRPGGRRAVPAKDGRTSPAGWTEGEVEISGAGLFAGYLRPAGHGDQDTTPRFCYDGASWWFRTGDTGRVDMAGRLWLTGRAGEVIRMAGEPVSAWEIEQVLLARPGVRAAAVVPEPDPLLGQVPKAYVAATVPAPDLAIWCAARLPASKCPVWWQVVPALPMAGGHRVAKTELPAVRGVTVDSRGCPRTAHQVAS